MFLKRAAAFVLALAAGALAALRESELQLEREGVIAGMLVLADAKADARARTGCPAGARLGPDGRE